MRWRWPGGGPLTGVDEHEEPGRPEPGALMAAVMREMAEPSDGVAATPVWLILLFFALAGWCGYYIGQAGGGFRSDVYDEHFVAGMKPPAAAPVDPVVLGRRTFHYCEQCHQESGLGIAATYPPLAGSPIVLGDADVPVRILLHGLEGPVVVKGAVYDGQMPSWERLSDAQIAAVLTYVRQEWGNRAPAVPVALVTRLRKGTAAQSRPWHWAELEKRP